MFINFIQNRFTKFSASLWICLLVSCGNLPVQEQQEGCRPFYHNKHAEVPDQFTESFFWKIDKPNIASSYILGTLHVSDPRVTKISDRIITRLKQSELFIMEALPERSDLIQAGEIMINKNGKKLSDYLDKTMYQRALEVMKLYDKDQQMVDIMKPWAVYLTMNYPADDGLILDFALLNQATSLGLQVSGLETMMEQLSGFEKIPLLDQIQLLEDSVCHYDYLQSQFSAMTDHYVAEDVTKLYRASNERVPEDDRIYQQLIDWLLFKRNRTMANRLVAYLDSGATFVAIGAMHLPGEKGVLALLESQGYRITAIH